MNINEIQDEIIEEFESFDDWMDKYSYLIEMSQDLEPIDEKDKIEKNLIEGCQSRAWLVATNENDIVHFKAESESSLVKGLVALVLRIVNDQKAEDIASADFYFIDKIGMKENLSPTRANGFLSMIKQIKYYAIAFSK